MARDLPRCVNRAPVAHWWAGANKAWPALETWLNSAPLVILGVALAASLALKGGKSIAFWMLAIVAVTINPCWYFLNEWIPMYMHDQHGLGDRSAGLVMVPIFVGGGLGGMVSGGIIKYLTTRGWSLRASRDAHDVRLGRPDCSRPRWSRSAAAWPSSWPCSHWLRWA